MIVSWISTGGKGLLSANCQPGASTEEVDKSPLHSDEDMDQTTTLINLQNAKRELIPPYHPIRKEEQTWQMALACHYSRMMGAKALLYPDLLYLTKIDKLPLGQLPSNAIPTKKKL